MANQLIPADENLSLSRIWNPLEEALEKFGKLLEETSPAPKQLLDLDPNETSFGVQLISGLSWFLDTLRSGSAAFSLALAIHHGWYPGGNLPLGILTESASLLSEGDEMGEIVLTEYYEASAQEICTRLARTHTGRANWITQSMNAHAKGFYWLSVPSFLMLA